MECGSNLRMIALASVVALAAMLPLGAATAGPAGSGRAPRHPHGPAPKGAPAPSPGGLLGDAGLDLAPVTGEAGGDVSGAGYGDATGEGAEDAAKGGAMKGQSAGAPRAFAECGPQLRSPERVEAQTCVLTEGRDTFGRTYYRNPTGHPLNAVMTLMRPDRRTVVVHCPIAAADEPGTCDTPRERSVRAAAADAEPYNAITEIGSAVGDRMLLRTGSAR
jgi:hypothetical protein